MFRFYLPSLVGRTGQSNTAQVITAGTPVGYDRSWVATEDTVIATVGIGFADGYVFSNFSKNDFWLMFGKLGEATSRLYRRQILQVNTCLN